MVRAIAEKGSGLRATDDWRVWIALVAHNDPEINEMLRRRYAQVRTGVAGAVSVLLDRLGQEPIPPLDIDRLTMLFDALMEGLVMRAMIDPALADEFGDVRAATTTYIAGVMTILNEACRPIERDPLDQADRGQGRPLPTQDRTARTASGWAPTAAMAAPTIPASLPREAGTVSTSPVRYSANLSHLRETPPPSTKRSGENSRLR